MQGLDTVDLFNPLAPTLGGERKETGGHPQTLGRDESLHPLGTWHLDSGDTLKELHPSAYPLSSLDSRFAMIARNEETRQSGGLGVPPN